MSGTDTPGTGTAAAPAGAAQRARVLQRPIAAQARLLELLARQTVASLQAGGQRSAFRGQGMEFDQVREYAVGDDARLIDWNVTSRMGSAFTKVFREERELTWCWWWTFPGRCWAETARGANWPPGWLPFSPTPCSALASR